MRKIILTVMAFLSLNCSVASAFWPEATLSSVEIGVGYRNDSFNWKTHSNPLLFDGGYYDYSSGNSGNGPRLTSKLDWKNLNIWEIEARGHYTTCDNVYLRGSFDYGWITSGHNTDKDSIDFGSGFFGSGFSGSGSGFQFAKSRSSVKGHVYDAKIAVGYQFKWCDDMFTISPLIGYSWHGQHFSDRHLRQNFYGLDDGSGLLDGALAGSRSYSYYDYYYPYSSDEYSYYYTGCSYGSGKEHSRYHARWDGVFIGFDFDYTFGCCCEWDLFGSYEFHWAEYHAKGKWHLRPDLLNGFNHHSDNAYGQVFDIGIKWDFCDCWTASLRGEFMWWWADHGHDRAKIRHFSNGDTDFECYVKTRLKDVRWDSAAVILDLGMAF